MHDDYARVRAARRAARRGVARAGCSTSVRYAFDESLYSPGDIWHGVLRGDTTRHLRFAADARKRTRVIPEAARDPARVARADARHGERLAPQ
jgi:hypothetical protein